MRRTRAERRCLPPSCSTRRRRSHAPRFPHDRRPPHTRRTCPRGATMHMHATSLFLRSSDRPRVGGAARYSWGLGMSHAPELPHSAHPRFCSIYSGAIVRAILDHSEHTKRCANLRATFIAAARAQDPHAEIMSERQMSRHIKSMSLGDLIVLEEGAQQVIHNTRTRAVDARLCHRTRRHRALQRNWLVDGWRSWSRARQRDAISRRKQTTIRRARPRATHRRRSATTATRSTNGDPPSGEEPPGRRELALKGASCACEIPALVAEITSIVDVVVAATECNLQRQAAPRAVGGERLP